MNLGEIKTALEDYLGGESSVGFFTSARRLRAINTAQDKVSKDLGAPRRLVTMATASPFALPTEARGDGLISIFETTLKRDIRVLSVGEANDRMAGWTETAINSGDPEFAIFDPGNVTAPIYIVPPHTTTRNYLLEYRVQPTALAADTDIPFNGDSGLTGYHYLIPLYAAFVAWDMDKSELGARERMRYLEEYNQQFPLAARRLQTSTMQAKNAFFRSFFDRR